MRWIMYVHFNLTSGLFIAERLLWWPYWMIYAQNWIGVCVCGGVPVNFDGFLIGFQWLDVISFWVTSVG